MDPNQEKILAKKGRFGWGWEAWGCAIAA
jgi:hypothetical protein